MSNYKPRADLKVKTREYTKDGETKGVWQTVGTIFSTPHGSSEFIVLDSIPFHSFENGEQVPFNGKISVFNKEEFEQVKSGDEFPDKKHQETHDFNKQTTKDVIVEDIDDKPIDLSTINIPF